MMKRTRKNFISRSICLTAAVLIPYMIIKTGVVEESTIIKLENDFQYNLIATAAVIAGFLFTGISILLAMIGHERIARLWVHHYLDNLCSYAFIGIGANIVTIIGAFAVLLVDEKCVRFSNIFINVEFMAFFGGLFLFVITVYYLLKLVWKLKPAKN